MSFLFCLTRDGFPSSTQIVEVSRVPQLSAFTRRLYGSREGTGHSAKSVNLSYPVTIWKLFCHTMKFFFLFFRTSVPNYRIYCRVNHDHDVSTTDQVSKIYSKIQTSEIRSSLDFFTSTICHFPPGPGPTYHQQFEVLLSSDSTSESSRIIPTNY